MLGHCPFASGLVDGGLSATIAPRRQPPSAVMTTLQLAVVDAIA
jgi:hypothetical protein